MVQYGTIWYYDIISDVSGFRRDDFFLFPVDVLY
jgi:hypothetical protein